MSEACMVFAVMVQFRLRLARSRYKPSGRGICHAAVFGSKPPGAESQYNFARSHKFVMVQKFAGWQMRVSGYNDRKNFSCQPEFERLKKIKKKKSVRAHIQHPVF
jgi:hypothetical protein